MIEKLKKTIKDGDFYPTVPNNSELMEKINEIIRHVNLHEDSIKDILEILQPDIAKKAPSSLVGFEEQRKWIGTLCKFWDDNYRITKHFGILTRIDETVIVPYEAENGFWYRACEPVKPDDDMIYKGE